MQDENVTVVKTDVGAKNGQNKCPKCGATEISLNVSTGKLRCNFCRHEFEPVNALIKPIFIPLSFCFIVTKTNSILLNYSITFKLMLL